ncbi:MAG: DegQ family serine endoprotease [Ectothiorhodospiraceae bacterium]|nr:DegQ family serine endoprotease [Ectothiorhodospiraceae bacterium]
MKRRILLPGTVAILFLVFSLAAGNLQARNLPACTGLVNDNTPAVVNISTSQSRDSRERGGMDIPDLPEDHPFRDFFDRFRGGPEGEGPGGPGPFDAQSLGSGFIISDDGYVLTNYHVVENADEVVVRLSDRRQYVAELVGHDRRSDVALLKIDAEDLPVVSIGSSTDLQVGEWVLAIGSPFGFEHSATAGIVSAKQRSLPQDNYVPFIQTDVAINPGNSGGPLFNLDGEVVGINSHIYSRTGGFMGLSFAIPIELAMDVVDQIRTTGRVARGWLGVLIQDVNRDLAESFGMDRPYGALVAQVVEGSPAEEAGLQSGDVIIRFEGREIGTSSALPPMVGRARVDSEITLDIIRDGDEQQVSVVLGELPEEEQAQRQPRERAPEAEPEQQEMLGMRLRPLTEEQREQLGLERSGLVVERVGEGPAAAAGVQRNDVILMLNQQQIGSMEDLASVVDELPRGRWVPMLVHRGGSPRYIGIRLPEEE